MLIAQISDSHIETARPEVAKRLSDLERTVAAINALPQRPDVVLHTGDIAHDASAADYAAARSALSRLEFPLYTTIGNRDRRQSFRDAFAADGYLPSTHDFAQYGVELDGLRLVAADTHDPESRLGSFCPARADDLERLLAEGRGRPTLVFLHHPPVELFEFIDPPLQYRDPEDAARLVKIIASAPGVVGAIGGHVHRSRTALIGTVPLSTAPAIAADLNYEELPKSGGKRPVFHIHDVTPDGISTASMVV
jgi:3',5'-cyclic AMP phosphodiesterase CpdA